MSDATLYRAAWQDDVLVAGVDVITGYEMERPMLGSIHEPAFNYTANVHRQALPFGSRTGTLELILTGPDAAARADDIDAALRVNGLYVFDCPHFPQLHMMRWAVAGAYTVLHNAARGRNAWTVQVPVKEVLG